MAPPNRLPELARLKTSELIRRAARELEPIDRVLAAEMRVRALWLEVARTDPALTEEQRRGVGIIEDADGR